MLPVSVAAALAWMLTPASVWLARRVGAVDHPGPRRVHSWPIPRLGGLAVVGAVAIVLGAGAIGIPGTPRWLLNSRSPGILLGLLPVLVVSVVDDIRQISPWPRFAAQALGAGIAMWWGVVLPDTVHLFGFPIHLGWAAWPLSALWIVSLTNAFNLVDGLDGLAAGLGLIAAASLAAVVVLAHKPDSAAAALVLCGALIGFLPSNLHPAYVFLGDCGATAIGFLLACFALTSSSLLSAGFAILIPVVIVGVPVADAFVSVLRRTVARIEQGTGNGVFQADSNHIHHRLLAMGLSHQRAVWMLYAFGTGLSLIALASLLLTYHQSGLLLLGVLMAGLIAVNRLGYGEFAFIRRGTALKMYDLPVMKRAFFTVFLDMTLVAVAVCVAVALKYDAWLLTGKRALVFSAVAVLVPAHVGMFTLFGVYKGAWRVAGIHDFVRLNAAIFAACGLGYVLSLAIKGPPLPVSLLALFGFVEVTIASGSRISYRILEQTRFRQNEAGARAIIYGAGRGGLLAARELSQNPERGLKPVGFIDDHPTRQGKSVDGYPVLGTLESLREALAKSGATVVVVASEKIPPLKVDMAARECGRAGARLLTMEIAFSEVSTVNRPGTEVDSNPGDHAGVPDADAHIGINTILAGAPSER